MNINAISLILSFLGDIFPVLMSIAVISFSAITNKRIKNLIKENDAIKFANSLSSIEYDISEILQLCVIKSKNIEYDNKHDVLSIFPFFIPYNRDEKDSMPPTKDPQERIYRLCGHICTYGTKKAIYLFNELQSEYSNSIKNNSVMNIDRIIALLALLVTQIRYDAHKETFSYKEWINIRLPKISFEEKNCIFDLCEEISWKLKSIE